MKKQLIFLFSLLAPLGLVLAQGAPDDGTREGEGVEQLLSRFVEVIIDPLITLLFAAALLYFFWGLFRLVTDISRGGDGTEGKSHMLWGIIGMVIMFTVGGIIGLVSNSIGADTSTNVDISGGFE